MSTTTRTAQFSTVEELIEAITPAVRRFAAHHTGSEYSKDLSRMTFEAQEMFQVGMLEIVKKFKPENSIAYYKKLADWAMLAQLRNDRVYGRYVCPEDELGTSDDLEDDDVISRIMGHESTPEDVLIRVESSNLVKRAISAFDAGEDFSQYGIIARLLSEGFGLAEIAQKLGVSYDTCYKRVKKIKKVLTGAGLAPAYARA